jgi:hypothetical protein
LRKNCGGLSFTSGRTESTTFATQSWQYYDDLAGILLPCAGPGSGAGRTTWFEASDYDYVGGLKRGRCRDPGFGARQGLSAQTTNRRNILDS